MARRRNAIFHRLSRMRGLPPEEKMLLQRIGNMMDAALNNRQASNPFEPSKNKGDRVLWPPTGLISYTGFRTLKLVWTAANSDEHSYYEIFITNTDTGKEETHKSFTNEFRFKGLNGNYSARVRSVGRDSKTSPWHETITFTLGGSKMQIEGSKNGPTELGVLVQDHITVYDNYSVYIWGSEVLDKYVAGLSNEPSVFRLWTMLGASQVFDEDVATLQQTITLYPATESASNLDGVAHAASITRPTGTRSGSFETSQSVMFSPIKIDTTDTGEQIVTFFLQALGRTVELDEVNLSIVLWGGFDGLGDDLPQDNWDGGPENYVFPHTNSLRIWREEMDSASPQSNVTKGRWYIAKQTKEFNIIDNQWTIAMWFRLPSKDVNVMQAQDTDPGKFIANINYLFARHSMNNNYPTDRHENAIEIRIFPSGDGQPGSSYSHNVEVRAWDSDGSASSLCHIFTKTHGEQSGSGAPFDASTIWDGSLTWSLQDYGWQFMVLCFEGGPGAPDQVFGAGTPKLRMYTNDRHWDELNPTNRGNRDPNGMECMNQRVADGALVTLMNTNVAKNLVENEVNQDLTNDYVYSIGVLPTGHFTAGKYDGPQVNTPNSTFTIHQIGFWNVAIDNWDGMGFNPGVQEQRDSSPWYAVPYGQSPLENPLHTDGRANTSVGSSMTAIHYLYNQGFGTDIDWKKNSNTRPDGAKEYIFGENLVHLWQFGSPPEGSGTGGSFAIGDETLRDSGNFLFGGGVNFLSNIPPSGGSATSDQGWDDDGKLSDVMSPSRFIYPNPDSTNPGYDPGPYDPEDGSPTGTNQNGIVYGASSDGPEGTTASDRDAYPGQGVRVGEHGNGSHPDWRRPNTGNTTTTGRTGVLTEPKSWGPRHFSNSLAQAELDNGEDPYYP